MRYRILGTTQALRPDGTAVPLGGARLRALLTVLALRAGRAVPTGLLVEEVWGGAPPADASGALQALVGRLRRALGSDSVASADGGYRLDAAPDDVDLHRFDRLAGEGTRALADGDPAKAAVVLDDALALWRGPVLADLPDRTAEAARWETRHLDTLRARHTAALGLGRAEHSLPELTALCDAHPLDEPLQALRLRALRDTGRTAEALAAYDGVRRLLATRLGTDPGPDLRALHAELLHPASPPTPGPAPTPGPGTTAAPGSGSGAGYGSGSGYRSGSGSGPSPRFGARPGAGSAPVPGEGPAPGSGYGPGETPGSGAGREPDSGQRPGAGAGAGSGPGLEDGWPSTSGAGREAGAGSGSGSGREDGWPSTSGAGQEPGAGEGSGSGPGLEDGWPSTSGGGSEPGAGQASGPCPAAGSASPSGHGPGPRHGSGWAPGAAPVSGAAPGRGSAPGPSSAPTSAPGPAPVPGTPAAPAVPSASGPVPPPGTGSGDALAPAPGTGSAPSSGPGTVSAPAVGTGTGPGTVPGVALAPGPVPAAPPGSFDGTGVEAPRPRGNLRARLTSFVGRDHDVDVLRADLATARLVTLLGPGGAGKTRLSQEVAERAGDTAPDGVWLAELAPVDDPAAVPEAVLTAVGARETVLYRAGAEEMRAVTAVEGQDTAVERLVEHCGRRRMLIVLDNCEHVVDAAARLTEELLARCPHLTVLATSREPLGVPGESLRPVEPLPEPAALRLLADRGAAARPGFRVDADEATAAACAEICRRLDGLPLAIELAAARLRMLTPRQIADRLDDRFRLLTSGSRTVLPRQQTLRAVVDWSWDLLDPDEREVLGRLSVFAGGCDLTAAEAVCGPAALDALGSLVDKSLVVATPVTDRSTGDGMRYRLLETVAEYAGERLDETGGRAAAARAHLTYYRELARTTDPLLRGPEQLAAVERLEREYENLRTALRHAVAERDEQEALCLALSLVWYWQMRDLRVEARNWFAEVMALGPDPFAEPARPAEPVWERCTSAPPPMTGEVLAEARRGVHLAHLACMDTELDAWQNPAAQRKLRVITQTYEPGMPQTCSSPGLLWFFAVMFTGDMERLHEIINATVRTCRETPGYDWELAGALQMRANMLANRSDWAGDALRDADESLEIYRRLGDAWGMAEALSGRAEARERIGDYELAAADYRSAAGHARRLGAHAQVDILDARLGSVLVEAGESDEGERILRDVIERTRGAGHNGAMPAARMYLAGWLGMTGRTAEAGEQLRLLREEFSIAHFVVFDAFILAAEAWLATLLDRHEECLTKIREALVRAEDPLSTAVAPHMRSAYLTIAAMGMARLDGGRRAVDGARCLGAADAMLPAGHVSSGMERDARERAADRVREVLGTEAWESAYAEGGRLSVEEAVALV
ncbi:BTAD domain-containing putative transcriptional regulator [Streptomyces sp. BK208]|uniref:AfsR/SARP family transcriptional regulator n=1 Tax=Streptomyces sp. BK208 TaxID=2512150 RepID=UPI001AAFB5B0|nr:BTAD domain-containing putative transcriptional regulator [Streptomyces sp. BK208]